jgi:predicted DNA-binding transcriptional regulator AlpA
MNQGKTDSNEKMQDLPQTGLLRIKQVLQFVPISRSSWWKGVKEGRFPQPVKLSQRVTCWKAADIRCLVEIGNPGESALKKQEMS